MQKTDLATALSAMEETYEIRKFLRDLCTPAELKALEERWRLAQILHHQENRSYADIHKETGASINTIGRVARFLRQEGNEGYACALKRSSS